MKTIGRTDKADFPELGLTDVDIKIDTGAYGCALHCHHVEVVIHNGISVLSFMVLDPLHPEYNDKIYYAKKFSSKVVKSSSGVKEDRYTIKTEIKLFDKDYSVEFSLTDRKKMKYPVLIGRKFLSKKYLVDVQKKDLSYQMKTNKK